MITIPIWVLIAFLFGIGVLVISTLVAAYRFSVGVTLANKEMYRLGEVNEDLQHTKNALAGVKTQLGLARLERTNAEMAFKSLSRGAHIPQLRAFASYILSRIYVASFVEDPIIDTLHPIAELLEVPVEIRTAKQEVHKAFPPGMALDIERLITGSEWTEAEGGPAVGGF